MMTCLVQRIKELSAGKSLWPGFDPSNVHLLEEGVLHTRYIQLRRGTNRIDMFAR